MTTHRLSRRTFLHVTVAGLQATVAGAVVAGAPLGYAPSPGRSSSA